MTIKSEEGRAKVTLSVDLGNLLPGAGPQQQPHRGRNGPARMRRRERRAEAQQDARAEEASEKVVESTATKTTDRVEVEKAVETTEKVEDSADIETTERVAFSEHQVKVKVTKEVADEFFQIESIVSVPKLMSLMILLLMKLNAGTLAISG